MIRLATGHVWSEFSDKKRTRIDHAKPGANAWVSGHAAFRGPGTHMDIPFCRPPIGPREAEAARAAVAERRLGGNGEIGRRVEERLRDLTGARHVLLTPNATQAIDIALIAHGIGPGDEVLMPSFAFVSQANSILARGAIPVFCEIDAETLNLCPEDTARRVTPRTRMIMPVHYAGVSCDMTALSAICEREGLVMLEDAAQAIGSTWKGRHLGTIGEVGCISFHETKNIIAGEGGCLLVDDDEVAAAAEIIREKGTNRSAFMRGETERYTWVGPGGSYVISDLLAAVLEVQLDRIDEITGERLRVWNLYHAGLEELEKDGFLRRPYVPREAEHNAHIYAFRAKTKGLRAHLLSGLREAGIQATFHFQPLHDAPFAREVLGAPEPLPITQSAAETLIRLPLYPELTSSAATRVVEELHALCHA